MNAPKHTPTRITLDQPTAVRKALARILLAHESGNNGAIMGESTLCQAHATQARLALEQPDSNAALVDALEAALADAKPISKRQFIRPGDDYTELCEETIWPDWMDAARAALKLARGEA